MNSSSTQNGRSSIQEGYFSHLFRNISNQFNKDPCRAKVHEQIIGSLIFWFLHTYFIFSLCLKNYTSNKIWNFPSLSLTSWNRRTSKCIKMFFQVAKNILKLIYRARSSYNFWIMLEKVRKSYFQKKTPSWIRIKSP